MVVLDTFMSRQCKHHNSAKEWHSKRLKIRSAIQTIPIIAEWMVQSRSWYHEVYMIFGKLLRNSELSGFRLSTIKSYYRPTVPCSMFSRNMSVWRITVLGLNSFLAQGCKHPSLPKHHRSDCRKTGSASQTISIIAEWMLKSHHI